MGLLKRLFSPQPAPRSIARRRRAQPQLEMLEDRTLLNNRFIVPFSVPANNTTTFNTLHAALTTAGLQGGNVIQIEPGSSPGGIVNADLPALANLIIQGDPGVSLLETPSFVVNDAITISAAQAGFTLKGVNVFLQGGGLTFSANGAITGSTITNNFAGTAITLNGTTGAVVTNSQIVANTGAASGQIIQVTTAANANNLISANTIVANSNVAFNLVAYSGSNTVTDRLLNNTLVGGNQATAPLVSVTGAVNGLTIQGNTFIDVLNSPTGLSIGGTAQSIVVTLNTFNLTGATGAHGIEFSGGTPASTTSGTISLNRVNTNAGIGMVLTPGSLGATFNVKVEGNDFHFNQIGVSIPPGPGGGAVTGIDLGGGTLGSNGGNNFRSFSAAASATSGAIVVGGQFLAATISAQKNIFSVANPETVIWDQNDDPTLANVDATGNLTGNAAYVQTLYLKFFHRVGNTTDPQDAGFWINLLNNNTPASVVANAIVRSPESLGAQVDAIFRQFLNRDPDAAGRASFISFLQHGGTLESATNILLTSPEYTTLYGSNGSFVVSLYLKLLLRAPSAQELAGVLAALPTLGRTGIANIFLHSAEYRANVVRGYYATLVNVLNPSPTDLAAWANSGLDLLTIQVLFASTQGFQQNA